MAERFGAFIAEAARRAGYDVDSPRGGGKTQLAKATGMSQASVSRMINGQTIPDPRFLEPLANALSINLQELLVRSGLVSEGVLPRSPPRHRRLTAREAAADLGITDPASIAAFETMVKVMTDSQQVKESSDGGR